MKVKVTLINNKEHILEVNSMEDFYLRFKDYGRKITDDIILLKNGVYINTKHIVEIIVEEYPS